MPAHENKQRIHAFFEALGRGNRQALHELCCEDLDWTVPQGAALHAGTHSGAGHVFELMLSSVGDAFVMGSQRINFDLIVAEGEVVMAEASVHAKGTNGRDYNNVYVFVFEFEDGKIRKLREHVDTRYASEFFV
ncbi:MAG: nuclear transport factor 2 family protein [Deltaproteobacteria bacterium]|nr:nuclear transport factor 2 family protein [Deltaproteobacteria bacterium]